MFNVGVDSRISEIGGTIYRRDPERFRQLGAWTQRQVAAGHEISDIEEALKGLRDRLAQQEPVNNWWAYTSTLIDRLRTKRLQGEAAAHSKEPINRDIAGALSRMMRGVDTPTG